MAHALLKVLYPQMEKELKNKLLIEAKEHVLQVSKGQLCFWGTLIPTSSLCSMDALNRVKNWRWGRPGDEDALFFMLLFSFSSTELCTQVQKVAEHGPAPYQERR